MLGSCQIAESLIEEPISPKMPASVYKSNPPGRKTGFPEKWLPKLRFRLQVSDMPTIQPSAPRSILDECIGDFASSTTLNSWREASLQRDNFSTEAFVSPRSATAWDRSHPHLCQPLVCFGSMVQRRDDVVKSAQQVVVSDDVHHIHVFALDDI